MKRSKGEREKENALLFSRAGIRPSQSKLSKGMIMEKDIIVKGHVCPPTVVRSVVTARELMNADVRNHIVLKDLARNAGTNECTLKKEFKHIFKTTVYQYLLKRRMKYAKHLLQTTDLKEKEITILCGYESLPGFITAFRKCYGVRPGELRWNGSSLQNIPVKR